MIAIHITTSQIIPKSIVRAVGTKLIATDKRITLSQDHDATGATSASFMITNTMKQTVPIPPFVEAAVTVLFAINPLNLKMPDSISIR